MSKLIAVIGATGAQGLPVIQALLAPSQDGSPSPYRVRALTRNPNHHRAEQLAEMGVEIVQGEFNIMPKKKAIHLTTVLFLHMGGFSRSIDRSTLQGSFLDFKAIEQFFDGAYGAFFNTDVFSV